MPADPDGKRQHVVEVLNTVDEGTSVLVGDNGAIAILSIQPHDELSQWKRVGGGVGPDRLHGAQEFASIIAVA